MSTYPQLHSPAAALYTCGASAMCDEQFRVCEILLGLLSTNKSQTEPCLLLKVGIPSCSCSSRYSVPSEMLWKVSRLCNAFVRSWYYNELGHPNVADTVL